jgi:parallel beta-helix repeat protein
MILAKRRLTVLVLSVMTVPLLIFLPGRAISVQADAYSTHGNLVIRDDSTGGDCHSFGTWDALMKSCTLTVDLATSGGGGGIEIANDGITLDGNGHRISHDLSGGSTYGYGVGLWSRSGVTVKNLAVSQFNMGIYAVSAYNCTIVGNNFSANSNGIILGNSAANAVRDNTVTGDRMGYGIQLSDSNYTSQNDIVAGNVVTNNDQGINISGGWNHLISGNNISQSASIGVQVESYSNNVVGNIVSNNNGVGIRVGMRRSGNTIAGNTIANNFFGGVELYQAGDPMGSHNTVYNNNFINDGASDYQGMGNLFNLPAPTGGNYWNLNTSCVDTNGDGFCDTPFLLDQLPLVNQKVWLNGRPSLTLGRPSPFWASYADYSSRELSVNWVIWNKGNIDALNTQIVNTSNNYGVLETTRLPVTLGNIAHGASASSTIKYRVPLGVNSWKTTISAAARDGNGITYTYP